MHETKLEVLLPDPRLAQAHALVDALKPDLAPQLRGTSFWRSGADLLISVTHVYHLSRFGIDASSQARDRHFRRKKMVGRPLFHAQRAQRTHLGGAPRRKKTSEHARSRQDQGGQGK